MSGPHADPALDALLLPFSEHAVAWPVRDGALFLRARAGAALHAQPMPGLVCAQSFKPEVDALHRGGFDVRDDNADETNNHDTTTWPLVMVLPPRQRDEARALFAEALVRLRPGGTLIASVANDAGAKSLQADLARLCGALSTRSKHKCRVFWSTPGVATTDAALVAEWRALDAPRSIADGRFVSRPGVFAWDRIDPASHLLAKHLPHDLRGRAADLGCGYGYLGAELLTRCPGIVSLDLFEAEARALALARTNLASFAAKVALDFSWHDVCTGLANKRYDVIVCNPPFHAQERAERPDLGRRFIAVAAEALAPRGQLWLVANRHLPYETVLAAGFAEARTVVQSGGYKVINAVKAVR